MASFAVILESRPSTSDGILLIVDDLSSAAEIAAELREKGHVVSVRELMIGVADQ